MAGTNISQSDLDLFIEETSEILRDMQGVCAGNGGSGDPQRDFEFLERGIHTIKGNAKAFGFNTLTKAAEEVLNVIRASKEEDGFEGLSQDQFILVYKFVASAGKFTSLVQQSKPVKPGFFKNVFDMARKLSGGDAAEIVQMSDDDDEVETEVEGDWKQEVKDILDQTLPVEPKVDQLADLAAKELHHDWNEATDEAPEVEDLEEIVDDDEFAIIEQPEEDLENDEETPEDYEMSEELAGLDEIMDDDEPEEDVKAVNFVEMGLVKEEPVEEEKLAVENLEDELKAVNFMEMGLVKDADEETFEMEEPEAVESMEPSDVTEPDEEQFVESMERSDVTEPDEEPFVESMERSDVTEPEAETAVAEVVEVKVEEPPVEEPEVKTQVVDEAQTTQAGFTMPEPVKTAPDELMQSSTEQSGSSPAFGYAFEAWCITKSAQRKDQFQNLDREQAADIRRMAEVLTDFSRWAFEARAAQVMDFLQSAARWIEEQAGSSGTQASVQVSSGRFYIQRQVGEFMTRLLKDAVHAALAMNKGDRVSVGFGAEKNDGFITLNVTGLPGFATAATGLKFFDIQERLVCVGGRINRGAKPDEVVMEFPETLQTLEVLVAGIGGRGKVGIPLHRVRDVQEHSGDDTGTIMWKGMNIKVLDLRESSAMSGSSQDVILSAGTGALAIRVQSVLEEKQEMLAERLPPVGPETVVSGFCVSVKDGERIPLLIPCWFPEESLI